MMANGKLTPKQRVFIESYLVTWNATESARQAGYKFPNKMGPFLMVNPGIKSAIAARMAEKAMKADEVLARLAEQARNNISVFIFSKKEQIVDQKTGETHYIETFGLDWDAIKQRGHLIKSIAPTANGIKLELYDGQAALFQIGKGLGILKETTEHTGKDGRDLIPFDQLIAALREAEHLSDGR